MNLVTCPLSGSQFDADAVHGNPYRKSPGGVFLSGAEAREAVPLPSRTDPQADEKRPGIVQVHDDADALETLITGKPANTTERYWSRDAEDAIKLDAPAKPAKPAKPAARRARGSRQ